MSHAPGFLKVVNEAKSRIKETTVDAVLPRVTKGEVFHLVDVREESEFAKGHIKGAVHIGRGILERDAEARFPDKNAEIVLYCGGGFRSALSADMLQQMGFTNVISMDGGWREWTAKNGPTE